MTLLPPRCCRGGIHEAGRVGGYPLGGLQLVRTSPYLAPSGFDLVGPFPFILSGFSYVYLMKPSPNTNGQGHFRALRKLGSAGLNHCGTDLSFDTLARQIVGEASRHQMAARHLSAITDMVCGVDGFWRDVRRFNSGGAMVISDLEVFQKVRGRVQLCAHLLYSLRAGGFFEPDTYACAALEEKTAGDSRLRSLIDSATRETGDHVTAPMTLAQWFLTMEFLIGGNGVGPIRLVCRNTAVWAE